MRRSLKSVWNCYCCIRNLTSKSKNIISGFTFTALGACFEIFRNKATTILKISTYLFGLTPARRLADSACGYRCCSSLNWLHSGMSCRDWAVQKHQSNISLICGQIKWIYAINNLIDIELQRVFGVLITVQRAHNHNVLRSRTINASTDLLTTRKNYTEIIINLRNLKAIIKRSKITHLTKQCAAESTTFGSINEPPQMCPVPKKTRSFERLLIDTWCLVAFTFAKVPLMMRPPWPMEPVFAPVAKAVMWQ